MADVIGGGIVGSSAAYQLACDGVRVTLVDGAVPGQATAAGAGIMAPGTDHRSPPAFSALSARSVAYYPTLLAQLADDGETDTGYAIAGSLLVAVDEAERARLDEIERLARDRLAAGIWGIDTVTRLDGDGAQKPFPPLAGVTEAVYLSLLGLLIMMRARVVRGRREARPLTDSMESRRAGTRAREWHLPATCFHTRP